MREIRLNTVLYIDLSITIHQYDFNVFMSNHLQIKT